MFAAGNPELKKFMAERGETRSFAVHEHVMEQGEVQDGIFVLLSGSCKVRRRRRMR